ncbi:universal stress protein [Mycolicibacterium pyrenivorans]|uniref:universal stress protein n=1 Tax=Mycolicibacterium pyrenivorans TaxID=187102 RepID=UPI0021F271C5|nr:universal stress protein [Mycolicibacterium pyrenivorans]MCV7151340.1 universal stress protein [Mycolicibacterium pyrenivorans]
MNGTHAPTPVVAGIDGSDTAVQAARWAADEAISRSVPLRLVFVTKATHPSADDYDRDVHHGNASLHAARDAMDAEGLTVEVDTAILTGPPGAALIGESRDAAMVCVGSVGIGRHARAILGSAATELAEKAHCPVAIIRPRDDDGSDGETSWIVVAVNDAPDNESVVEHALAEARLRKAPVLALGEGQRTRDSLDRDVEKMKEHHPEVHIYPVADQAGVAHFLRHNDERIQLTVIGGSQADQLADIVGPFGHAVFRHGRSSVLIVRR